MINEKQSKFTKLLFESNTYKNSITTQDEFNRINCIVVANDFDTSRPNPYRIGRTASEINEYLKYKRKLYGGN